jgi:hypothetical protein
MGAENATRFASRGVEDVDLARLNSKRTYAVVTSNKGSYLAEKGPNNQLIPRTNMKAGDPSLSDGQMVVQEYKIQQANQGQQGIRSFQPSTSQYTIKQIPSNSEDQGNQWKKVAVEQPAKQPDIQEFLNKKPNPPNPFKG